MTFEPRGISITTSKNSSEVSGSLWRDIDLGCLDMDNGGVASTTLDKMGEWDVQTETLCGARR